MVKESVLFASSEVYPFAKSGGLADVSHSLPCALAEYCDVCVVMPLYRFIDREKFGIKPSEQSFEMIIGSNAYSIQWYECRIEGVRYRFVYSPVLCEKEYLYGPPEAGYEDNAIRFGIFNYAIVDLLKKKKFSIAHLNDWQCALVPLLIKSDPSIRTKTLYTIHNLAYQGTFDPSVMEMLGLDAGYYTLDGIEFYGQVSFMKAGIAYSDRINTVSPTYAQEILTPEFGCGLEGFLQLHRDKLTGIVNGIDTEHFSPSNDGRLIVPYTELKGKRANKSSYLKENKLKGIDKALIVFIGRLTWQKGMDILISILPELAMQECNVAVLGEGENRYIESLESIASEYPNIRLHCGYDETLAHRLYAAADFVFMPSLFEPCGLNQLIAFAYGAFPVVRKVGGLADTVQPIEAFDPKSDGGFGITFEGSDEREILNTIDRGFELYRNKRVFNAILRHNMGCDFSWHESAKGYLTLYRMCRE